MKEVDPSLVHYVLYPSTVPIIAAKSGNDADAMPAVWTTTVSLKPPLIMTAIAPERYTYKLIRESGYFTVNLMDFSKVSALAFIGDVSARFIGNKLELAGIKLIPARKVPSVIIDGASAVVECRVSRVIDVGGDHDIFIGKVINVMVNDDFTDGGWRLEDYRPILYVGRTHRPSPVMRRFTTVGQVINVEYAKGMRNPVEERRRAQELAKEIIKEYAGKLGKDPRNATYILLDTIRNMLSDNWEV
ncbi:flavin reductase family protein [Caldivirga maquilingensis]|uniref:Flavin reductase domain protein FMN-binding n=1 Tax=Caldivirga maquilingensis (strain ATCC 700844 / DSM 13496 / JCM 10307 / IC-167) TaxID=397948 RepID=A8MDG1_CALMQ|nr:flavin reductase family protein [Caldivirga maquilingensis]ABW01817.1 flavin reductase domain protein FMN-binding [Caldivirga maquilingensis IC-167]